MDELNGEGTATPGDGVAAVMQGLQVLFAGHQITHQVLGGIIRHLATGQPVRLTKQAWQAIGIEPQEASSIVVVPPGVKLAS